MKKLCLAVGTFIALMISELRSSSAIPNRFEFSEPQRRTYVAPVGLGANLPTSQTAQWIYAWPEDRPDQRVELGRRVVLAVAPGTAIAPLLGNRPLRLPREIHPGWWVLEAPDAWIAAIQAEELHSLPQILACFPAARALFSLQDLYAPAPSDPYFSQQWHLEYRNSSAEHLGADLNTRAAWPITRGENILVAVVDNGVELTHPDLAEPFSFGPHFNFGDGTPNAGPSLSTASHGTAVAGLIGAQGNNQLGVSGVAPGAKFASWVIFKGSVLDPDTVEMKSMFEAQSNIVHVQNHSWGAGGTALYPIPPLEEIGISNAVFSGRDGRGVLIVRASSNGRKSLADANADGYAVDPRVITVSAARSDGRTTRYSNPGACVLVGAPSAEVAEGFSSNLDSSFPSLVTTDLTGFSGANASVGLNDSADYRFGTSGFSGTSGSTPLVSGVVALMLSANPTLSYRDVQQALLLSSRHLDLADPLLLTNGAGLRVSYNLGYGIPDAGAAVQRALQWTSRPALTTATRTFATNVGSTKAITDDGLRVEVTGTNVPAGLASIPATATFGAHADAPTTLLPITAAELANQPLESLTGRAALVSRGGNSFTEKIQNCANAGAQLVLIYNNQGTIERSQMLSTDFASIPAVMIGRSAGTDLSAVIATNSSVRVRLRLLATVCSVEITNTLISEHVKVRLQTDHSRRGDLRVTLVSPSGTRSILQRLNNDSSAGPADWTYSSVAHFYESTAGTWKLEVSDQEPGNTGNVLRADLTVSGVAIRDTDRDGLDDTWETSHWGNLASTGSGDPDADGVPNSVEQVMHTNPLAIDVPFRLDVSPWSSQILRLSWPGLAGATYRILESINPEGPYTEIESIPGAFPVTEYFTFLGTDTSRLLRVERVIP
jgi:subtilisin family serine protease/subtilisin-like proprotein convertase family protein